MAFTYAGSLNGGAPVVREFTIGETMYTGQLAQAGITGGLAQVQIADAATDLREDDTFPLGVVTGIVDDSRAFTTSLAGTARYGDSSTYSTSQSVIKTQGPGRVQVTLAIPGITLLRAPLFNGAWGTPLAENTILTTNAAGTSVIVTSATADFADKYGTAYCRTGANKGVYRNISSVVTTTSTITIPFPYTITSGDKFVLCGPMLGYTGIQIPASADCVDGNTNMADYYAVFCHELNLENAGEEYMVFSFWSGTGPEAA